MISITAIDNAGSEQPGDTLVFDVSRDETTTGPIVVALTWSGTAIFGTDYTVTVTGGSLSADGRQLTMNSGSRT